MPRQLFPKNLRLGTGVAPLLFLGIAVTPGSVVPNVLSQLGFVPQRKQSLGIAPPPCHQDSPRPTSPSCRCPRCAASTRPSWRSPTCTAPWRSLPSARTTLGVRAHCAVGTCGACLSVDTIGGVPPCVLLPVHLMDGPVDCVAVQCFVLPAFLLSFCLLQACKHYGLAIKATINELFGTQGL